ncbi:MAG TPA: DUF3050 domain-containing protein [Gemmatimonadaceae bacterium]|nr:DUF3050 domain-containing protein [Gemmatimonadaceae bacterium]
MKSCSARNATSTPSAEKSASSAISNCLLAMEEVGADTRPMREFLNHVARDGVQAALRLPAIPPPTLAFVRSTFQFIAGGKDHCTAAAFAFGREDLIPGMFGALLERMNISEATAPNFHYYLRRHIQLDGDEHGALALELVSSLCGHDDQRTAEALDAAEGALEARIAFGDGVLTAIKAGDRQT